MNTSVVLLQEAIRLEVLLRAILTPATNPDAHFAVRRTEMGVQSGPVGLVQITQLVEETLKVTGHMAPSRYLY